MTGPVENGGTIGILPNHFLTQFKPGGADYAHNIGMSQPTYKPFRRDCMGFLFILFYFRQLLVMVGILSGRISSSRIQLEF